MNSPMIRIAILDEEEREEYKNIFLQRVSVEEMMSDLQKQYQKWTAENEAWWSKIREKYQIRNNQNLRLSEEGELLAYEEDKQNDSYGH